MLALLFMALVVATVLVICLNARAEVRDEPGEDWRDEIPHSYRTPR